MQENIDTLWERYWRQAAFKGYKRARNDYLRKRGACKVCKNITDKKEHPYSRGFGVLVQSP